MSDFEPNYLAAVDFYDEDFLWRYSPFPVAGAKHRLRPWIVLIVLKDEEFERLNSPGRPSPAIKLKAKKEEVFPVGEEFAWAHVHLNAAVGADTTPDLAQLKSLLDRNPDAAYARLLCPRKLTANTSYTGFIVPALDVGRRAGLGDTIAENDDGSKPSWDGAGPEFPVYYEWRFRTGLEGDFELLVRALVPRDMDPRVGVRDLDVSRPGFGVAAVTNPPDGRVSLEGALLAPTTKRRGLESESDFAPQVAAKINAPADAMAAPAGPVIGASDPVVAPPIYGSWHAGVDRVELPAQDAGWVPAVNLDPRYRAAAGLGARVVRKNQDAYMRSAWGQIGDVLTVNAMIRRAQLATKAASAMYSKTLVKLDVEYATALASPVFAKVMGSPTTLRALVRGSRLPSATLSPAFRKLLRPRGRLARTMLPADSRQGAISTLVGDQRRVLDGKPAAAEARWSDAGERDWGTSSLGLGGVAFAQCVVAGDPCSNSWFARVGTGGVGDRAGGSRGGRGGAWRNVCGRSPTTARAGGGESFVACANDTGSHRHFAAAPGLRVSAARWRAFAHGPLLKPPLPGADSNDAADMRRALIDFNGRSPFACRRSGTGRT